MVIANVAVTVDDSGGIRVTGDAILAAVIAAEIARLVGERLIAVNADGVWLTGGPSSTIPEAPQRVEPSVDPSVDPVGDSRSY